jgi:maleylacetoacetate isomerase/maleylpyruvate isomerase
LLDGGQLLTQSLAICEYLDEAYPDTPALLPRDLHGQGCVRWR